MLYPVAVEAGDTKHAFGVVVPDLPGCFSAGDTFEEALVNAREAIELHVEGLLDAGEQVPVPSPVDRLVADPDLKGFVWARTQRSAAGTAKTPGDTNGEANSEGDEKGARIGL